MELAPNILAALTTAGKELNKQQLTAVLQQVTQVTQQPQSSSSTQGTTQGVQQQLQPPVGLDVLIYKVAFSGLSALTIEAARYNAPNSEITSILEDCSWSESSISQFLSFFDSHRTAIRTTLSSLSSFRSSIPSLIDSNWRLDYYIKSNLAEELRQPLYFVTLNCLDHNKPAGTANSNSNTSIQMTATLEELQDLLSKVKDAVKQVQHQADE